MFLLSLKYHGYHIKFGEYDLFKTMTYKKVLFHQIFGPGLIYLILVFSPLNSPKNAREYPVKGNIHLLHEQFVMLK